MSASPIVICNDNNAISPRILKIAIDTSTAGTQPAKALSYPATVAKLLHLPLSEVPLPA